MNNIRNLNDIHFLGKHIGGGSDDDSLVNFNNQMNIITNKKTDQNRMIDYFNELERDKNKNNKYVERLDNEKNTNVYRLNNFPTYVEDVNYSNPLIYPKDSDPYFNYLDQKNINPLNTQVIKKKEYINIDSANRITRSSLNISKYLTIKENGLEFKNDSNILKIYFETPINKTSDILDEFIILRGFRTYVNYYENLNFFFTNNSPIVIIDIKPNFANTISYINISIVIENLGISDNTGYFKNIPYQLLNGIQKVFIENFNSDKRLALRLPINYYSANQNDNILTSSCKISFNCLGNYPINLINANTPLSSTNLINKLTISKITTNYIEVLLTNTISLNDNITLDGYWKNDSFFTGKNIQIGIIDGFIRAYNSANNFNIFLEKTYNNIAEIKIISSIIPNINNNILKEQINSTNNINSIYNTNTNSSINVGLDMNNNSNITYIQKQNNKLYWENILDDGIYSIELETGNYTYPLLKKTIETKVSQIKRKLIINNEFINKFNTMEVYFTEEINESKFIMYDIYNIPNCFTELTNILSIDKNIFKIKIYFPNHNLSLDDTIFISDSIDYYTINKEYINSPQGHKVTNIFDNDYFEIILTNINLISDTGDTKGGFSIGIKKYAIFRLYFNFENTFGELMGFRLVGFADSITNYAGPINNYMITNKQQYFNDIGTILLVNNVLLLQNLITDFQAGSITYLLLLADGLNNNNNPNGPSYFYKFLINTQTNNFLFNTFVNSPIYFVPPIRSINELKLTLVYPNGGLVDIGNLNYSLVFEITTINNIPENTNINTNMSRI